MENINQPPPVYTVVAAAPAPICPRCGVRKDCGIGGRVLKWATVRAIAKSTLQISRVVKKRSDQIAIFNQTSRIFIQNFY